jgi:uncharacterized protein (TIGR02678 family)
VAGADEAGAFTGVPGHEIADFIRQARERYGRYWRKSAREPGTESELADIAVERLEKLQLVERRAGSIRARPALARFALGEADVHLFGASRHSRPVPPEAA